MKEKYLALKIYDEESIKKLVNPKDSWITCLLKRKNGEIVLVEWFGKKYGWAYCDTDIVDKCRYNKLLKEDKDFYGGKSQEECFFQFVHNCFEIKKERRNDL